MEDKDKKEPNKINLPVNTATFVGSKYSQLVGVMATDSDITLEFVYVNPRDQKGEVVSRVTLPKKSGEELAKVILNTINLHDKKKEGTKND